MERTPMDNLNLPNYTTDAFSTQQVVQAQLEKVITRLQAQGCKPRQLSNGQWLALCPAHDDSEPSLSITLSETGKVLLHCFAGCDITQICDALGISIVDLSSDNTHHRVNLTLAQLADCKKVPCNFLASLGWRDTERGVAIPFSLPDGHIVFQYRHALDKDGANSARYFWEKGTQATKVVYGFSHLCEGSTEVWLTESALDAATLQFVGLPAIAVAGQGNAKAVANFANKLSRVDKIIVWSEPDAPNFARDIAAALGRSVFCVQPEEGMPKDANRLWLSVGADKERFLAELSRLRERAVVVEPNANAQPSTGTEHGSACPFCELSNDELLAIASPLINSNNPLSEAAQQVAQRFGLVAEEANLQLLLLALTSRVFTQPISVLVTGGTGQGKSFLTDAACAILPPCRHRRIVGASARALLFHPLAKGTVLQWLELPEISGDSVAATILRSILWQAQNDSDADYIFVEWTVRGARRRSVKMPKQVALITTRVDLPHDDQLLSRFLVVEVKDTADKRLSVLKSIAQSWNGISPKLSTNLLEPITAFQEWLGRIDCHVEIPYASILAELFAGLPPSERDFRDFATLLKLVAASALWNFKHRGHEINDNTLVVIAGLEDYEIVRNLIAPIWGKARTNVLSESENEVCELLKSRGIALTTKEVAEALQISESAARGRLNSLKRKGVIVDEFTENGRSKAWRLVANSLIVDPLPTVEAVLARWQPDHPPQPPAQPSETDRLTAEANDASVGSVEALESVETPSNAKNANKNWGFHASVGALDDSIYQANKSQYTNDDKNREYGNSSLLASNDIKIANASTDSEKSQQTLAFSSVGAFSTHPNASTLASADARPNSPTTLPQQEEVGQLEWFKCPNCGLRRLMSPDSWLLAGRCPECGANLLPDQPDPPSGGSSSRQPQTDDASEPTEVGEKLVDTLEFLEQNFGPLQEIQSDPFAEKEVPQEVIDQWLQHQLSQTDQLPEPDQPPRKTKLPPSSCRELANDLLRILREFQRSSPKHQRCLTDPCPTCRAKARQVRYLERTNSRNGLRALWQRAQAWQQQQGGVGA